MKHKGDIDLGGNDLNNVGSIGAGVSSLSDVNVSLPSNGEILKYDGAEWVNDTIAQSDVSNLTTDLSNINTELDAVQNLASTLSAAGAVGDGAIYFSNFDSGATLTAGKLYYLHATTGWEEADASAAATATNLLAMCTSASTNGTSMLQSGVINAFGSQSSAALGVPMYISETSGEITETAPTTSGAIVRVIGYKVNNTDDTIFFNPSNDWIELS
jgi:hypothetical protein